MQFEFETLSAEFTEERAVICQNFTSEAARVMRIIPWIAIVGFVLLIAVGNTPFALFWLAFLIGIWWFVRRNADHFRNVVIDKTTGHMVCSERTSGGETETRYELAQFRHLVLLWTRDLIEQANQISDNEHYRYRLCFYCPMSEAQIEADLPEHLAAGLKHSSIASKLILGTARASGVSYVEITLDALRSEQDMRRLSDAVMQLLAPDYDLISEDKFAPSMFSQIHG